MGAVGCGAVSKIWWYLLHPSTIYYNSCDNYWWQNAASAIAPSHLISVVHNFGKLISSWLKCSKHTHSPAALSFGLIQQILLYYFELCSVEAAAVNPIFRLLNTFHYKNSCNIFKELQFLQGFLQNLDIWHGAVLRSGRCLMLASWKFIQMLASYQLSETAISHLWFMWYRLVLPAC